MNIRENSHGSRNYKEPRLEFGVKKKKKKKITQLKKIKKTRIGGFWEKLKEFIEQNQEKLKNGNPRDQRESICYW